MMAYKVEEFKPNYRLPESKDYTFTKRNDLTVFKLNILPYWFESDIHEDDKVWESDDILFWSDNKDDPLPFLIKNLESLAFWQVHEYTLFDRMLTNFSDNAWNYIYWVTNGKFPVETKEGDFRHNITVMHEYHKHMTYVFRKLFELVDSLKSNLGDDYLQELKTMVKIN